MVIVPTGQRMAHRPQRMHRVSSFQHGGSGDHSQLVGRHFVEFHAEQFLVVADVLHGFGLERDAVERNQFQTFSGQTSTQPPHRMHMVPSSGVPSKIVLTQQCRQRCASAIAAGAS